MLIRRAEIEWGAILDVRIEGGRISAIDAELLRHPGEACIDAAGGALLPGLHDHHTHLLALARARESVRCGPPEVENREDLRSALIRADSVLPDGEWIRGVAYHASVAGELDRVVLDAWFPTRPVRIQHRSGALWMLNSAGLAHLGLEANESALGANERALGSNELGLVPHELGSDPPAGIDRDAEGRPTGRLYRLDAWLRSRLQRSSPPDLAAVGGQLASFGVTGLTDATPSNASGELSHLVAAVASGALPQQLVVMGAANLPEPAHPRVARGAVKVMLAETDLPRFEELVETIVIAHRDVRPIAIHCVTRAELVLATGALAEAGCREGDRIEHASIAPPDLIGLLAALPLTVVTQPNFIRERGDAYRVDVEERDRSWLYRCRGFLDAAIPLGAGTDAPFGDPDPWLAMQAAVDRHTRGGTALGPEEGIAPERALALFTTTAAAPGGSPRRVAVGARADLCLLDRSWSNARDNLESKCVAATLCAGEVVFRR